MKKYEILEHKADFKIRVFGKSKEELFLNALLGMVAGLQPEFSNQRTVIRKIKVSSVDLNALLVDFLSEALYLIQANKEAYDRIVFARFNDNELTAELSGKKIERFGQDIKAVTHHDLAVGKNENGVWQAVILFDV
jgi:SHS2 domain-containing protein